MVISIILAFCIPLTLGVGGYFILKAFELGKEKEWKQGTINQVDDKFEHLQVSEEKQKHFQEMIDEYMGN